MPEIPLIEPVYCPPVFALGFVVHKLSSACVQLTFYTQNIACDGVLECPIVAKIVRPIPLLVAGPQLLSMAQTCGPAFGIH